MIRDELPNPTLRRRRSEELDEVEVDDEKVILMTNEDDGRF